MNAKAERIENLIQVINRNLLLIYNGQIDGIIPLDNRPTARVDTSMFKGDKFGYEMVNFVRSYAKNQRLTIAAIWERNFVKGLETLITECAVVKDDIERECFVSRVYVWFVEKLVERRDLPESNRIKSREISELKDNVRKLGGHHTLKALDNYAASRPDNDGADGESQGKSSPDKSHPPVEDNDAEEWEVHHLPSVPAKQRKGNDLLQQHYYPDILNDRDLQGHYQPETEAEIAMNELWIARRRQEAFEWKARQNVDLIMDRRALHKSRLESEALRRQETSSYLAMKLSKSSSNINEEPFNEETKFAPRMRRPLSGRKHFANIIVDAEKNEEIQKTKEIVDIQPNTTLHVIKNGVVNEAVVATVQRKIVEKIPLVPMRYKIDPPEGYAPSSSVRKNSKGSAAFSSSGSQGAATGEGTTQPAAATAATTTTLQNNASNLSATAQSTTTGSKQSLDKRISTAPPLPNRHQKIYSRKVSVPKLFSELAHLDNELQVHLEFSNSRRMPMTEEQIKWLAMKEHERQLKYKEYMNELSQKESEKELNQQAKSSSKDKDKKKGENNKSKESKQTTVTSSGQRDAPPIPPPILEDPEEIMQNKFPIFDSYEYPDAQGSLRCQQLEECNRVYEALSKKFPNVDMNVIERALVAPQDRNLDVCLENLRRPLEGLMVNPLPVEYWRTSNEKTKKKKTKKTKSKKK